MLTPTLHNYTVQELAEYCHAESVRYQQTGDSDERYCLELFRRALQERDERAWEALYSQYQHLVRKWVRGHSRFLATGEDEEFFANAAFSQLWRFASQPDKASVVSALGKSLSFLKMCTWTVVTDYYRKQQRDALREVWSLEEDSPVPSPEDEVIRALILEELRQRIEAVVQDEREQVVVEESWVYGLPPRQIQARHADIFSTVAEVSQMKRNILNRLRRSYQGQE